jgi:hypothetical protein
MMMPGIRVRKAVNRLLVFCVMLTGLWSSDAVRANEGFWLITPEEAASPPAADQVVPRGLLEAGREEPDTGPLIDVLKPLVGKAQPVPLEIVVKFEPRNAPVDVSSLKVTLVKFVPIDITDRVRPYTSPEGIRIPDARLPSGEHTVRISLADNVGGVSRKQMTVTIQ